VIGILAGLFAMGAGNDILGAANRNDADFRTPLGALVSLAGLVILAIPAVGLISLIGSAYAKSAPEGIFGMAEQEHRKDGRGERQPC
jgi:hypothetical protein